MLCVAWGRHVAAEEALAAMTPDELVNPVANRPHPLLRISRDAAAIVAKLSKEFGLTPSSRPGVHPGSPPPPPAGGGQGWSQFS